MNVIATLIVFSVIGAVLCARTRAAGPALFFGVVAVFLFCTTPLGEGLPHALAVLTGWIGEHGSDVAQAGH